MKNLCTIAAVAAFLFITTTSSANIYRVGYNGPKKNNVDYTTLAGAVSVCSTNPNKPDTIYLFPGIWSAVYDRKIVTIGFGYYVDTAALGTGANKGLQNITGSLSTSITVKTNAKGCIFQGIDGLSLSNSEGNYAPYNTDSITVIRCQGNIFFYSFGSTVTNSNWQILQSDISINPGSFNYLSLIQNVLVSNCVIRYFRTSLSTSQTGVLINNVFTDNWYDPSFTFKNNVFLYEGNFALLSTSTYNYNIFVGNITGGLNGSHNKTNQNKDAIFTGYSSQKKLSNDGRWELKKPNSPAIGAGENGIDCGIYAQESLFPYKLSGIPAVPSFYQLEAPSSTTGTGPVYQITFSVRSNN